MKPFLRSFRRNFRTFSHWRSLHSLRLRQAPLRIGSYLPVRTGWPVPLAYRPRMPRMCGGPR